MRDVSDGMSGNTGKMTWNPSRIRRGDGRWCRGQRLLAREDRAVGICVRDRHAPESVGRLRRPTGVALLIRIAQALRR